MSPLPPPDHVRPLADGRKIAFDDRGDPSGSVILYMHGTPDTRLARHPDDSIVADRGYRLIATDRPGLGGSDPDPASSPTSVADDHVELLDSLTLHAVHVVAWSAGAIFATALAGAYPDRVLSLTLVAPLIPADAYSTPGVTDGAGAGRTMFADMALDMDPEEAGRELAPWLVPAAITDEIAREHLADSLSAVAAVEGAGDALVAALIGSVAQGMGGMEREITAQAIPLGDLLDAVRAPVTIHAADADDVCPPTMAHWYSHRLTSARTTLVDHPGRGHEIGITLWDRVVALLP